MPRRSAASSSGTATETYKIPVEDIVIDPLARPVGADTLHPTRMIEMIAMIRAEFGVNMTLGASNVSFGMPDRDSIAATSAHRHQPRADQRDHGRPRAADRPRGQGRRLGAEPGRVGRRAGSPRTGRSRPHKRPPRRRRWAREPRDEGGGKQRPSPFGSILSSMTGGAGSVRRDLVRRGQLERHRHRLDLRRPRHLQEAPGQDRRGPARAVQPGHQGLHGPGDQGRLAAGLPHYGYPGYPGRGAAADHPAQGRHRRRRAAGHPAPGGAEAVPGAGRT